MQLPIARTTELIEQDANNELLIYDLRINKAYTLNETSKTVFNACNEKASFDDLKREYKYTDELIYLTLDELKKNNLIEGDYNSPFAGTSRREVVKRVGLASMIALPVISGLVAPQALHAASSGACRAVDSCIAPGDDICANCAAGRTVNYKVYGTVSCGGGSFEGSTTCNGAASPNTTGRYLGVTSVT